MNLIILASLFLASSLGKITSTLFLKLVPIDLLSVNIPGVTSELASAKTYDMTDFVFTLFFSFLIFFVNYSFYIRKKTKDSGFYKTINLYLLASSVAIFLQSHFVESSGKLLILSVLVIEVIYLFLISKKSPQKSVVVNNTAILNSFFAGLFLFVFLRNFTQSFAIPLIASITLVLIYVLWSNKKFVANPSHLILILFSFFFTKTAMIILIGVFLLCLVVSKNYFEKHTKFLDFLRKYIYPIAVIFIVFYNPLFYIGNLDSVEEGFWLSWLQRLIDRQAIYKDFFSYHPPIITWGLYLFTSVTQYSVYYFRMFMHLLQVAGLIIIYFCLDFLLERKINKVFVLLLVGSLTVTTFVRNNSEIRIAVGLLPIIFYYIAQKNPKAYFISGALSVIAILTSVDSGIAGFGAVVLAFVFFDRRLESIKKFVIGFAAGLIPFLIYFVFTNSLVNFVDQISFYAKAFSQGYFNAPVDRYFQTAFFRWHLFYEYLSTNAWFWEISRMVIVAGLIYLLAKFVKSIYKKKFLLSEFDRKDKYFFALSFYGAILFRSALGRSDFHHLLFVLVVALILLFYFVEKYLKYQANILLIIVLLTVMFTKQVNAQFTSDAVHKFDTYGRRIGDYQALDMDRGQIFEGMDANKDEMMEIVNYIQKNTDKNDKFFAFPWSPELYFLANRGNSTSFDEPYAFFSETYQKQMIDQLQSSVPKIIVYDTGANFGGLTPESLKLVNDFILDNYSKVDQIQSYKIYQKK